MPALSSLISYRPKRKRGPGTFKISSPFPIKFHDSATSPHPYALPRVLDIRDDGALPSHTNASVRSSTPNGTPRVYLDVEISPESLADWFPSSFHDLGSLLNRSESSGASGSGTHYGDGRDATKGSRLKDDLPMEEVKEESDHGENYEVDEGVHTLSSAEDILADLEAMDASNFGNIGVPYESSVSSRRKLAPSPIKIPSTGLHSQKTPLMRSSGPSRPTSQASEFSAISGTTLARALMANSFVLSDPRATQHLSGFSILTRTDSATLPHGDYSLAQSPYWRDRFSTSDPLSPLPAPLGPIPPVPDNAEQVYVAPMNPRHSLEPSKRRRSSNTQPEREHELKSPPVQDEGKPASQKISEISEIIPPTTAIAQEPPLVQEDVKNVEYDAEERRKSPGRSSPTEREETHQTSISEPGPDLGVTSPEVLHVTKEIDNVLDYYSFSDTNDLGVFRLPFSPITEESSSQLSPPAPYSLDNNGLGRGLPAGRFFIGAGSSAANVPAHVDWTRRGSDARRVSRDGMSKLLPIGGDPPPLVKPSSGSSFPKNPSTSLSTTPDAHTLELPPLNTIFNNQRSGHTPSPIKVTRDSHDPSTYNITVTPQTDDPGDSMSSVGDNDLALPAFPETPTAFSPALSGLTSPGSGHGSVPWATVPATSGDGSINPSVAQRVLLTRAATSVHGARHSRQGSLSKLMRPARHPYMRHGSSMSLSAHVGGKSQRDMVMGVASSEEQGTGEAPVEQVESTDKVVVDGIHPEPLSVDGSPPPVDTEPLPLIEENERNVEFSFASLNEPPLPSLSMGINVETPASVFSPHGLGGSDEHFIRAGPASNPSPTTNTQVLSRTDSNLSSGLQSGLLEPPKALPPTPPSPGRVSPSPQKNTISGSGSNVVSSSSSSGGVQANSVALPRTDLSAHQPEPLQFPTPISTPTAIAYPSDIIISPLQTTRRPAVISPQPTRAQLLPASSPASSSYSLVYYSAEAPVGSPPPYYSVVHSNQTYPEATVITPGTGGSFDPYHRFFGPSQSTPSNTGEVRDYGGSEHAPRTGPSRPSTAPSGRRSRGRPPLPVGPRRPSQQVSVLRERGGSESPIGTNRPSNRRMHTPNPLPSPKFETPPAKFRGYTLDAAKWTLTSTQLQGMVSRAIRQSSEASSIRLLRLETLDNDIPEELERLTTKREDVKVKYKALARRRATLLESATNCLNNLDQDSTARMLRLVEDLRDVTTTLDRLAEELHSVDEQYAQVTQLCQLHSASALAMALRKLNTSFLKQYAEAQSLRQQVEALETERDEAWRYAEQLANDYDDLRTGKVEVVPDYTENRSKRLSVARNLSLRTTKAGLRSAGRRASQRSSIGSNIKHGAGPSSSSRTDEVPSVPRTSRHRPVDIKTNLPLQKNSMGVLSSGLTPTSETRAMIRAQEELYSLLGITSNDSRYLRPRSIIGLPGESEQASSPSYSHYDPEISSGRRASLPGNTTQPDAYDTVAADLSIILTSDRPGWI